MEKVTPIKPDEVQTLKDKELPEYVIEGFNQGIVKYNKPSYNEDGKAVFTFSKN